MPSQKLVEEGEVALSELEKATQKLVASTERHKRKSYFWKNKEVFEIGSLSDDDKIALIGLGQKDPEATKENRRVDLEMSGLSAYSDRVHYSEGMAHSISISLMQTDFNRLSDEEIRRVISDMKEMLPKIDEMVDNLDVLYDAVNPNQVSYYIAKVESHSLETYGLKDDDGIKVKVQIQHDEVEDTDDLDWGIVDEPPDNKVKDTPEENSTSPDLSQWDDSDDDFGDIEFLGDMGFSGDDSSKSLSFGLQKDSPSLMDLVKNKVGDNPQPRSPDDPGTSSKLK